MNQAGGGREKAQFRRGRNERTFGGIAVKQLQALQAFVVEVVMDVASQVATDLRLCDAGARCPGARDPVNVLRFEPVIAGVAEQRGKIEVRAGIGEGGHAHSPEGEDKWLAGVLTPEFGEVEEVIVRG